jgi:hypothetical protein
VERDIRVRGADPADYDRIVAEADADLAGFLVGLSRPG